MSKKNKKENGYKKIALSAKTEEQREVIKSIKNNQITFIHGVPGSGKSHIATVYGLKELLACKYKQLIFTRPCKESNGEKLGSLPGNPDDKIAPYMIPLFEILKQFISQKEINTYISEGIIRTLPLAYYRGVTFNNSFVVADEFQNTIPEQMRLFLTRFGRNSKIVVTGDIRQSDIGPENGMADAMRRLSGVKDIAFKELTYQSIVRNPIIADIEERYSKK